MPDRFDCLGWHVVWTGWREPHNQIVTFGFWIAFKDGENPFWYSSTLGVVDLAKSEFEPLDTTYERRDWPHPSRLSDDDKEQVKALAREELLAKLRGERVVYDDIADQRAESMKRFYASR